MRTLNATALLIVLVCGCNSRGNQPVDIFPEDNCSNCRMAISNMHFASEIIDGDGSVFKFDDIGCMLKYRQNVTRISAIYVKDFETKGWIPFDSAFIAETTMDTPMGSGKVAFRDSIRAKEVLGQVPNVEFVE